MKLRKKVGLSYMVVVLAVGLPLMSCGCIRLVGSAGYSYQGKDDEMPKGKSVTLDTQELLPGGTPGSIQNAE